MRRMFYELIKRSHPSSNITIDQVLDYGDCKVALFRVENSAFVHNRCAVFAMKDNGWSKENDIIVSQQGARK